MLPPKLPKSKNRSDRWRSPAHCNFVRSHACSVPGCVGLPIEVAHFRKGSDAALSRKPSDWHTISLCQWHHSQQHSIGEDSFAAMYLLDLQGLTDEFAKASPKWPEIRARKAEAA